MLQVDSVMVASPPGGAEPEAVESGAEEEEEEEGEVEVELEGD